MPEVMICDISKLKSVQAKIDGLCRAIVEQKLTSNNLHLHKENSKQSLKVKRELLQRAEENLLRHKNVVAKAIIELKIINT